MYRSWKFDAPHSHQFVVRVAHLNRASLKLQTADIFEHRSFKISAKSAVILFPQYPAQIILIFSIGTRASFKFKSDRRLIEQTNRRTK